MFLASRRLFESAAFILHPVLSKTISESPAILHSYYFFFLFALESWRAARWEAGWPVTGCTGGRTTVGRSSRPRTSMPLIGSRPLGTAFQVVRHRRHNKSVQAREQGGQGRVWRTKMRDEGHGASAQGPGGARPSGHDLRLHPRVDIRAHEVQIRDGLGVTVCRSTRPLAQR